MTTNATAFKNQQMIILKKPLTPKEMNKEAFNKLMGYPMETIEKLVKQAKEINRNSIIALNNRDLKENGIEQD